MTTPSSPYSVAIALGRAALLLAPRGRAALHADVADAPWSASTCGEAVCTRRHELRHADWLDVARMLPMPAKEVVLSTPVLVESDGDIAAMRRVCDQDEFLVEANDLGAVRAGAGGRSSPGRI